MKRIKLYKVLFFSMLSFFIIFFVEANDKIQSRTNISLKENLYKETLSQTKTIEKAKSLHQKEQMKKDIIASSSEKNFLQEIEEKLVQGGGGFMSIISIFLILGLCFCIERILYLNMSDIDYKKFLEKIEIALQQNNKEKALLIAKETRGPIASIIYQGILRKEKGLDVVEKSIISYGNVQMGYLEKNLSWITLFISLAPTMGFLGTVIGMVKSFQDVKIAGDISPTVVASGMEVALITTIAGLIVAMILQIFYNYILTRIERLTTNMEDATIDLIDILIETENYEKE